MTNASKFLSIAPFESQCIRLPGLEQLLTPAALSMPGIENSFTKGLSEQPRILLSGLCSTPAVRASQSFWEGSSCSSICMLFMSLRLHQTREDAENSRASTYVDALKDLEAHLLRHCLVRHSLVESPPA